MTQSQLDSRHMKPTSLLELHLPNLKVVSNTSITMQS